MSGNLRPHHVAARTLGDLAAGVGRVGEPDASTPISGVTHDSAAVRPGDLFAALPGTHRHGGQFAAPAVAAGAAAILTDGVGAGMVAGLGVAVLVVPDVRAVLGEIASAVYGHPSAALPVVGITGTAGKTSTAYLIESGLRAAGHTTSLIGTVETRVADVVVESVRTTPEATDLHALLAAARERGVTAAVMEVSSHALVYGRAGGVRFAVGAFTNFGSDHLDFHSDVEEYFAAKARLFEGVCRAEVLNLDDPAVRRLVRPGRVSFSAAGDPHATWWATDVVRDGFAQRFIAHGPPGAVPAWVSLPGRHNVANALLAIACLAELGVDPQTAAQGVAACRGVPGRLQLVAAPGPVLGVVDYAHKPDAIVAALAALRELTDEQSGAARLICVIGAGGDRDRGKRPQMGAAAAHGADLVIVTDDNPRTEDPAAIRLEVLAGARAVSAAEVMEVAGRRAAIAEAVRLAGPGDVVALLGKGHESGQEIAGVSHPFDDRVELAAALAERFAGVRA